MGVNKRKHKRGKQEKRKEFGLEDANKGECGPKESRGDDRKRSEDIRACKLPFQTISPGSDYLQVCAHLSDIFGISAVRGEEVHRGVLKVVISV